MTILTPGAPLAKRILFALLITLSVQLPAQSPAVPPRSDGKVQMASLHSPLVWQRTSPPRGQMEGPVLYQLLLNASGTPGVVPAFDKNPRHLVDTPISVSGGVVTIGGSKGLVVDANSGILTFAGGVSLTGQGTGGLTSVSHDATLAGFGTAANPLGVTAGGITTAQISSGAAALGQVLTADGAGNTNWQSGALPPTGWALAGNAGTACTTSPCASFLGTTDNSTLEFRAGNAQVLRIEPPSPGSTTFGGRMQIGTIIGGVFRSAATISTQALTANLNLGLDVPGSLAARVGTDLTIQAGRDATIKASSGQLLVQAQGMATIQSGASISLSAPGGVGIGVAPAFPLDVNGAARLTGFVLPTGAGAGKVLTSDANGNATWQAGGTVTQINTGAGLTGGPITAAGTISVANGGISTQQITSGKATLGQVLTADGAGAAAWLTPASGGGSGWLLAGNAATGCSDNPAMSPCTSFLGTTGPEALEMRVNNMRALRFQFDNIDGGDSPSIIAGFGGNTVGTSAQGNTIAGGGNGNQINQTNGSYSTVGGGHGNTASGSEATVAGGTGNHADGGSAIGGGSANNATTVSFVGGGVANSATGINAAIAGGAQNIAAGQFSAIPGGRFNLASGYASFAAGYRADANSHPGAFVWSDFSQAPPGPNTFLQAGADNQFLARATGGFTFVTGSDPVTGAPAPAKTVTIAANSGVVGFVPAQTFNGTSVASGAATTGQVLTANGTGGASWTTAPGTGTITAVNAGPGLAGGGSSGSVTLSIPLQGVTSGFIGSVGAASGQVLTADGAGGAGFQTVSGGIAAWGLSGNSSIGCTTSPCAKFLGTTDNSAVEMRANNVRIFRIEPRVAGIQGSGPNVILGENGNSVTAGVAGATVAGGEFIIGNKVTDDFGTIGGGRENQAGNNSGTTGDASDATVGGGTGNTASAREATVSGGSVNTASGISSTVAGGATNMASGNFSIVLGGHNNLASGIESTVAGGQANTADGSESFAAGCGANTNGHAGTFVWSDHSYCAPNGTVATADNQFVARGSGGVIFYTSIGGPNPVTGVQVAAGGGSWGSASDRNLKEHFAGVDNRQLLARVLALPITTWNYKTQAASIRHIGPMAQDFYAAFTVGEDDKHITTIDEGGVALAAIQGLNQKLGDELREKDAQIAAQQRQIEALQQQVRQMLTRIEAVERVSAIDERVSQIAAAR